MLRQDFQCFHCTVSNDMARTWKKKVVHCHSVPLISFSHGSMPSVSFYKKLGGWMNRWNVSDISPLEPRFVFNELVDDDDEDENCGIERTETTHGLQPRRRGGLWIKFDHLEIFNVCRNVDTRVFSLFAFIEKAAAAALGRAAQLLIYWVTATSFKTNLETQTWLEHNATTRNIVGKSDSVHRRSFF